MSWSGKWQKSKYNILLLSYANTKNFILQTVLQRQNPVRCSGHKEIHGILNMHCFQYLKVMPNSKRLDPMIRGLYRSQFYMKSGVQRE